MAYFYTQQYKVITEKVFKEFKGIITITLAIDKYCVSNWHVYLTGLLEVRYFLFIYLIIEYGST